MPLTTAVSKVLHASFAVAAALALLAHAQPAAAQVTAFKQAIAETAVKSDEIASFYRDRGYDPIWVGSDADDVARREAFLSAVSIAPTHGLPTRDYSREEITEVLRGAASPRDRGRIEVEMSRMFLQFARDLQSGILVPGRIDRGIKREAPRREAADLLDGIAGARPNVFIRGLMPSSPEYRRLVKERMALEEKRRIGGWGPTVQASRLEPGDSGDEVVALRNRLSAMGYLARSATRTYDKAMEQAVRAAQTDYGLAVDGIAGDSTLAAINVPIEDRIGQILVAMERERWMNMPRRGDRHVLVNLTDFTARIIDKGVVTFETKAVIGKDEVDRETPEFSDMMEHLVINPYWYVPRSIIVNEYLPTLRQNPYALGHMEIIDRRGRTVNRANGFAQYTDQNFPFSMRQPPSPRNALGQVKFMFPNRYNIYLHDTPAQNLFERTRRAFSHGCIRLDDPYEFAYALLARQEPNPEAYFQRVLNSGREARVSLETPVPVHLIYRTAFTKPEGGMQYREDVYGRDAKILSALRAAGVATGGEGS